MARKPKSVKKYQEYLWQTKNRYPERTVVSYEEWMDRQRAKGCDPDVDDCRVPGPNHLSRLRFSRHRAQAKYRNIPFEFTWEQWHAWWLSHGIDRNVPSDERGSQRLCMCRYGDTGAYSEDNVYLATIAQNNADAVTNGVRRGRPKGSKNKPKG